MDASGSSTPIYHDTSKATPDSSYPTSRRIYSDGASYAEIRETSSAAGTHRPRVTSGAGKASRGQKGWDPRTWGWSRRRWAFIITSTVVVVVIIIVVAVVASERKRDRYPDYKPLRYTLNDTYSGDGFFDKFDYFTGYDPAGGLVHYVPRDQAQQLNLTYTTPSSATLRVDNSTGPSSTPDASTGRLSVRITSRMQYQSGQGEGDENNGNGTSDSLLFLFDVRHAPLGCGTWPALWLTDPNDWPESGEIDIMEAVNPRGGPMDNDTNAANTDNSHSNSDGNGNGRNNNNNNNSNNNQKRDISSGATTDSNQITLHTSDGCEMSAKRRQTGTALRSDCKNSTNDNAGCGVEASRGSDGSDADADADADKRTRGEKATYGPAFNDAGGGVLALEWRPEGIRVWQFARDGLPPDIPVRADPDAAGLDSDNTTSSPDPSSWGTATADFPGTKCDIGSHFRNLSLVANVDICGGPVDAGWASSGCPGRSCAEFQAANPGAFSQAYWAFGPFMVYRGV